MTVCSSVYTVCALKLNRLGTASLRKSNRKDICTNRKPMAARPSVHTVHAITLNKCGTASLRKSDRKTVCTNDKPLANRSSVYTEFALTLNKWSTHLPIVIAQTAVSCHNSCRQTPLIHCPFISSPSLLYFGYSMRLLSFGARSFLFCNGVPPPRVVPVT